MNYQQKCFENCIKQIIEKTGWGDLSTWTHSHFEKLRENIFEKTSINISSRTLKRLFGKEKGDKSYHPQIETKNAFAIYLGYKDWFDYVNSLAIEPRKFRFKPLLGVSGVLVILAIGVYFVFRFFPFNSKKNYVFSFNVEKNSGTIPFVARFNYDISEIDRDSIFIQFGVMKTLFPLSREKKAIYYTYKTCGVFNVILFVQKQPVDTVIVYAYSAGIESLITNTGKYFPARGVCSNGILTIPMSEVLAIGNELNRKEYWTKYSVCKNFNISADSFSIQIRFKGNTLLDELPCPDMKLRWAGENNDHGRVHFVQHGCSQLLDLEFSEKKFKGIDAPFLAFEVNIRDWNTVCYSVKDKKFSIRVNDSVVFENAYQKSIGKLYYFSVSVRDQSMIDYINVVSTAGDTVFYDDFL